MKSRYLPIVVALLLVAGVAASFGFNSNGSGGGTAGIPNPPSDVTINAQGQWVVTSAGGGQGPFAAGFLSAGVPPLTMALGDASVAESLTCGKLWFGVNALGLLDYGCTTASKFTLMGGGLNIPSPNSLSLGFVGSFLGSIAFNGNTSGTTTVQSAAAAGGTFTLPTVNTTGPTANPGTSGMALVSTTAGVQSYQATEAHLGNAGAYGNNTNFPSGNIVVQAVATNAGHFTQMTSNNQSLNGGSCSTAPTFNVFDGGSNTGTAKIASAAAQVTRGTTTQQAETLTFAAGDVIGIYVSTQGATCLAPTFSVDATVTYP